MFSWLKTNQLQQNIVIVMLILIVVFVTVYSKMHIQIQISIQQNDTMIYVACLQYFTQQKAILRKFRC